MTSINLPQLSDVLVIVLTLCGEGIGESFQGKQMIADTIHNYAEQHGITARQSCLLRRPDRYSCWANPKKLMSKMDSFRASPNDWMECIRLARALASGWYKPTSDATHYINPKLVKRMPLWAGKMRLNQ